MDITEIIREKTAEVVDKIRKNPSLAVRFSKEPVAVIEEVLGVDLPDDTVKAIVAAVKANMTAEQAGDLLGSLKKLF